MVVVLVGSLSLSLYKSSWTVLCRGMPAVTQQECIPKAKTRALPMRMIGWRGILLLSKTHWTVGMGREEEEEASSEEEEDGGSMEDSKTFATSVVAESLLLLLLSLSLSLSLLCCCC